MKEAYTSARAPLWPWAFAVGLTTGVPDRSLFDTCWRNGRWDSDYAFKTEAEPLFKLLSEPKRLEVYDGGHIAPPEIAVPIVSRFLDETLGPVRPR